MSKLELKNSIILEMQNSLVQLAIDYNNSFYVQKYLQHHCYISEKSIAMYFLLIQ